MAIKNRAVYFHHPDFDSIESRAGLQLTKSGGLQMVDEDTSVRQAILLILSTAKGERVMRHDYGCDLDQLAFMPTDETTLGLAIHLVRQALRQWEPRIDILQLDAEFNKKESSRMDIMLNYRVRRTSATGNMIFPITMS